MVILLALAFLVICISVDAFIRYRRKNKQKEKPFEQVSNPSITFQKLLIPKGLYFDKGHSWAFMDTDGKVKVGINDFLHRVTGVVSKVDMKRVGEKIEKGEPLFTLSHLGKQISISAPISGTIKKVNNNLSNNASLVNDKPYTEGWIYSIEPQNWLAEIGGLMFAEKAQEWFKKEIVRLKDFFASLGKPGDESFGFAVLQDGGAIMHHVLADLSPEVWEEFQVKYLDNEEQTI